MKAIIANKFDRLFLGLMSVVWRVMKVFDPRPVQEHYARRDPANAVKLEQVMSLPAEDCGQSIVRLGNNRIISERKPTGIAKRGDLVKIKNPANGKFVILYAMGAGSHGIPGNGLSLDYDAKLALGIQKQEEAELLIGIANVADREFFLMYLDADKSSRSARALGWYLFVGGLAYSIWDMSKDVFAYVAESQFFHATLQAVISLVAESQLFQSALQALNSLFS